MKKKMNTIYHYTDINGFFNIMQSKTLWLSDAKSLNDSHETKWALGQLYKVLSKRINDNNKEKLERFWIEANLNYKLPYICSFSKNGDLLSQWRGYADDAQGVAIGFNWNEHWHSPHEMRLEEVIYDQEKQDKFLHMLLNGVENGEVVGSSISLFNPIYKNPAFIEEDEVRLIYTPNIYFNQHNNFTMITGSNTEIKHRVSRNKIISYFEFPFSIEDVSEIVLAPKCQINKYELMKFLSSTGFINAKITYSGATYR